MSKLLDDLKLITDEFSSLDFQKLTDFVFSIAERKDYLKNVKHKVENNSNNFYIWEIKNCDKLTFFAEMNKVNLIKRKRVHKKNLIESYFKLISFIEKVN